MTTIMTTTRLTKAGKHRLTARKTKESQGKAGVAGSRPKKTGNFIISTKAKKSGIKNVDDLKVGQAYLETIVHQQQCHEEEVQRYISGECTAQD